jgi:NAD(P)H-flavin reductase
MTPEEFRKLLNDNLADLYKNREEGQILYSGIDTLRKKADFYILGFNPRPDPSNRELKELANEILPTLENWSAYTCQCWHQKHTQHKTFLHCNCKEHEHPEKSNEVCKCGGNDKFQRNVVGIVTELGLDSRRSLHQMCCLSKQKISAKSYKETCTKCR